MYHGIDERYPYSSLRHHNSLLDAAVDVSRLCAKNGIRHALHVAREGHRPSVMKEFAKSASLIITDLFLFHRGISGLGKSLRFQSARY